MHTLFAKDFHEEVRRTIDDTWLSNEGRRGGNEADHLYDSIDSYQGTEILVEPRDEMKSTELSGLRCILDFSRLTTSSRMKERPIVKNGQRPREKEHLVALDKGRIAPFGCGRSRKGEAQKF
jgi:hypothetical protein